MNLKKLILIGLLALNLTIIAGPAAFAQVLPLPEDPYKKTFVAPKGDSAYEKTDYVVRTVIRGGSYLIAGVAILLAITGAVQLITSQGNEEAAEKAKKILLYSVIGIAMIALANELSKILDLSDGGILGGRAELEQRFRIFEDSVTVIITFMKYIIGSVAVLMLVTSGARMVAMGSNEEEVAKDKKKIAYVAGGLVALIFVDNLIRNVLYKIDRPLDDPTIDVGQGIREVVSFTNLIINFVGPIAILTLVAGGLMYTFSGGNEETQEKARKMMITSLIGIVLIYGAFGLVSTIIAGKF